MSMPHPSRNDPPPVCEYGGRCKPGECSGPCGNDPRWTERTAFMVQQQDALHRLKFSTVGAYCTCQRWQMRVPFNAVDAHASHERHRAHELLTALADAGVLVPPDALLPVWVPPVPDGPGEWWAEYGVEKPKVPGPGVWIDHGDGEDWWTEAMAREDMEGVPGAVLMRRRSWIGPWEEAS